MVGRGPGGHQEWFARSEVSRPGVDEMPSGYAILTPWLIPDGTAKSPNVGDFFITDAAVKLIGSEPRLVATDI